MIIKHYTAISGILLGSRLPFTKSVLHSWLTSIKSLIWERTTALLFSIKHFAFYFSTSIWWGYIMMKQQSPILPQKIKNQQLRHNNSSHWLQEDSIRDVSLTIFPVLYGTAKMFSHMHNFAHIVLIEVRRWENDGQNWEVKDSESLIFAGLQTLICLHINSKQEHFFSSTSLSSFSNWFLFPPMFRLF